MAEKIKSKIPIINQTNQFQEIHYKDETINIQPGEEHILDITRITRPEFIRITRIFTEIKVAQEEQTQKEIIKPKTQVKPVPESSNQKEGN